MKPAPASVEREMRPFRTIEANNLLVGQFCADLLAGKKPLASMEEKP